MTTRLVVDVDWTHVGQRRPYGPHEIEAAVTVSVSVDGRSPAPAADRLAVAVALSAVCPGARDPDLGPFATAVTAANVAAPGVVAVFCSTPYID